MTEIQSIVVDARLKDGYTFIGEFPSMSRVKGNDIGLVKGRHRIHINALGYDTYLPNIIYQEVK